MIGIVNYGLGNVRAFLNLYKRIGIEAKLIDFPDDLLNISHIILPGVGSFDVAMRLIVKSGFKQSLDYMVLEKKVPVLGVCLGMQIMSNFSEEGDAFGLGWIKGSVRDFSSNPDFNFAKPHMGWNSVTPKKNHEILTNLKDDCRFYFLHSYFFECEDSQNILLQTSYQFPFTSAVQRENIFGVQFHPEKSHQNGITLLKNFALL